MNPDIRFVRSNDELHDLAQSLTALGCIGIDTEFVRTRTYYARLGIIQIWDGQSCFIVEPDEIDNWKPLADVMENQGVTKILHSGSEDLEIFRHHLGSVPTGVFDTQIAGALAGVGGLLGYQPVVRELLGVELEKGETRSNWLQRPLTQSQLHYAALDVTYLLDIHNILVDRLTGLGRLDWAEEEFSNLLGRSTQSGNPEFHYRRFGRRWQLNGQQRWLLMALCRWREETARRRDRPRNWIVDDKTLFTIAEAVPSSFDRLKQLTDLPVKALNAMGPEWLRLAQDAATAGESEYPAKGHRPLSRSQRDEYKAIRTALAAAAETLNIPSDLLATRKDMESFLRAGHSWEGLLNGWRKPVLRKALEALMPNQPAEA